VSDKSIQYAIFPLTPQRWEDLEKLFGPRGADGGCWCMYWRLKQSDFNRGSGEPNKQAFKQIVDAGEVPGLLAYVGQEPVGWVSLSPREVYPKLERSRILQRVDDQPVWSIVCFFIARGYRRKGLSAALIAAAVQYASAHGACVVEGYSVEPKDVRKYPMMYAYTGLASAFRKAGFKEVVRRSDTRPIMRYVIKE
jgi:GNAT superfamily N-acetyltransferase